MCSRLQNLASEEQCEYSPPTYLLKHHSSVKSILQVTFMIQQLYERQCLEHLPKSQALSVTGSQFFHDTIPEGVMKYLISQITVNLISTIHLFSVFS